MAETKTQLSPERPGAQYRGPRRPGNVVAAFVCPAGHESTEMETAPDNFTRVWCNSVRRGTANPSVSLSDKCVGSRALLDSIHSRDYPRPSVKATHSEQKRRHRLGPLSKAATANLKHWARQNRPRHGRFSLAGQDAVETLHGFLQILIGQQWAHIHVHRARQPVQRPWAHVPFILDVPLCSRPW